MFLEVFQYFSHALETIFRCGNDLVADNIQRRQTILVVCNLKRDRLAGRYPGQWQSCDQFAFISVPVLDFVSSQDLERGKAEGEDLFRREMEIKSGFEWFSRGNRRPADRKPQDGDKGANNHGQ